MSQRRSLAVSMSLVAVVWSTALGGQAPAPSLPGTFVPDWTFKGSALTGTDQIGQATWRAENGEIIGTPTSADGGWLLINPGYQDVQFAVRTGVRPPAPPASCCGARRARRGSKVFSRRWPGDRRRLPP